MRPPARSFSASLVVVAVLACGASAALATRSSSLAGASVEAAGLNAACPETPPSPSAHCMTVPAQLIVRSKTSNGGCGRFMVMQVPLVKDAISYGAAWTNSNPGAARWIFDSGNGGPGSGEVWSTKAITSENTGDNLFEAYPVPKGNGAWFVDAGGGPGACDTSTGTAIAWAWTAHPIVSGQVTVQGTKAVPAPRVVVQAECPGGGATSTDIQGDYAFELDPGTTCTIAPKLKPGHPSSPVTRIVHVGAQDIKHVDFTAPCDGIALSATTNATGGWDPCSLIVTVTPAAGTAGLTLFKDTTPSPGAGGNFQENVGSVEDPVSQCVSGCIDLLVHVAQAGATPGQIGAPVAGARVTSSAGAIGQAAPVGIPDYPTGNPSGGYLCVGRAPETCGVILKGLATDKAGNLRLIYWAPGVISPKLPDSPDVSEPHNPATGQLTIDVTTPERSGQFKGPLAISEHELYFSNASLPSDQAAVLADWGKAGFDIDSFKKLVSWKNVQSVLNKVLTVIAPEEAFGVTLLETLEEAEHVHGIFEGLTAPEELRIGLLSFFLSDFGITPNGLGVTTDGTHDGMDDSFVNTIIGTGLSSTGGLFYKFAQTVSYLARTDPKDVPQGMQLNVVDVSYCDIGGNCLGDGDPRTHAFLDFYLSSGTSFGSGVVVPYSPHTWAAVQSGLINLKTG
jgi:hypothetical protein